METNLGKPIAMPAPPVTEAATTPSPSSTYSKSAASKKPATQSQAAPEPTPGPSQDSPNSTRLADLDNHILDQIIRLRGAPTPLKKHYEQIHHLWKLCDNDSDEIKSHPFVHEYQRLLRELLQRFTVCLKDPPPSFRAQPQAELVNTMDSGDVQWMVVVMDEFVKIMGINFDIDSTDPVPSQNIDRKNREALGKVYAVLLEDVVTLGFLSWLAKNRHDFLDILFKGKFCIYRI